VDASGDAPWRVPQRQDLEQQKIEGFLAQSAFRARFESKGRLSAFCAAIPTKLIVNRDAALLGAARAGVILTPAGR